MRETLVRITVGLLVVAASTGCAVEGAEMAPDNAIWSDEADVATKEANLALDATIDFEHSTIQTIFSTSTVADVVDGTQIDSLYPGVTFSSLVCSASNCVPGHAYARNFGTGRGMAVSLQPAPVTPQFNSRVGVIEATFANPVSWASVDATPTMFNQNEKAADPAARPWLEAYDANGTLIQKVTYPYGYGDPSFGTTQVLTVQGAVKRVRFSSRWFTNAGNEVFGLFDNMRFPTEVTPTVYVPPPILTPVFPGLPCARRACRK